MKFNNDNSDSGSDFEELRPEHKKKYFELKKEKKVSLSKLVALKSQLNENEDVNENLIKEIHLKDKIILQKESKMNELCKIERDNQELKIENNNLISDNKILNTQIEKFKKESQSLKLEIKNTIAILEQNEQNLSKFYELIVLKFDYFDKKIAFQSQNVELMNLMIKKKHDDIMKMPKEISPDGLSCDKQNKVFIFE